MSIRMAILKKNVGWSPKLKLVVVCNPGISVPEIHAKRLKSVRHAVQSFCTTTSITEPWPR